MSRKRTRTTMSRQFQPFFFLPTTTNSCDPKEELTETKRAPSVEVGARAVPVGRGIALVRRSVVALDLLRPARVVDDVRVAEGRQRGSGREDWHCWRWLVVHLQRK